jgi:serine/threonine protein kinase/Flp pilus assembly protein TadD
MPADPKLVRDLFLAAAELPPGERETYLNANCGDAELRVAVDRLLAAHEHPASVLNRPGPGIPTGEFIPNGERPGTVIGPYKLLEQIGEGGFGVVFMAEQSAPVRRKVALKVLKPGMDTRQVVARFEAERQALALMDHPNIARVLDGGQTTSGRPYFVMDLVKGLPITDYCDQAQLTPRERLGLFVHLCQAVQHAHLKGVIHRDLKPTNVLVMVHDTTPVVKVIDFGVAKALGQELTDKTLFTGFAQMIGTPLYMSPEQAGQSGVDIDTRSDIYSLGVLLYELLTGTTPFDKERLKEVGYDELRRIIREEEPPRPSTRISTLGKAASTVSTQRKSDPKRLSQLCRGELDWIAMKCLDKDRNRRYETASALAADVQRYLHDEPVLACPPSAWYRFRKFTRRKKTGLVVTGCVFLALAGIAGGIGWAVRDHAARDAKLAEDRAARRARMNLEVEHALQDATKARDQALKLADHPYQWKAAFAEAASELKRAQGLAAQDEMAVSPAVQERLEAVQALLNEDETDHRFAMRFDEIRLEQTEVNVTMRGFKKGIAFAALKDAFRRHYRIAFGEAPAKEVATSIQQRPKPIQDILLAALEVSLEDVAPDDRQVRPWLAAVLDAADTGPWRKRAQQALKSKDWKAFEQVVEEAVAARQPQSLLVMLARKTAFDTRIYRKLLRRIAAAHPGDFWPNIELADDLQYRHPPQLDEAIRYYGAALAVRPGHPTACVDLGNALRDRGDLDAAINAYRAALRGHPDYIAAHECLRKVLEKKGDLDGVIADLRQVAHQTNNVGDHLALGHVLQRKGLLDEAISEFTKVMDLDPKFAPAWAYASQCLQRRAAAYLELKEYNKAAADNAKADELYLTMRTKAIEQDPKNTQSWLSRAHAYRERKQYDKAVADFTKAIELDPNAGGIFYQRALAYGGLGQFDKALADYTRAIELVPRPTSALLRRNRGQLYTWLQQYDKALADLN